MSYTLMPGAAPRMRPNTLSWHHVIDSPHSQRQRYDSHASMLHLHTGYHHWMLSRVP